MATLIFFVLMLQQQIQREQGIPIVPAISYEIPASMPCNKSFCHYENGVVGVCYSACVTGPELHWGCLDSSRILLVSEDGRHYCFSPIGNLAAHE